MTLLQIMPEDAPTKPELRTGESQRIRAELSAIGVHFEQWPTADLPADADDDTVLGAYREQIDNVVSSGGYQLIDVARMVPSAQDPQWPAHAQAAREKFLEEHFHDEDEVRFFAQGAGCFYLHVDGRVYAMVCTAGDLLAVPAKTVHWFDMGSNPHFTAVRFFQEEDGWIGKFLPASIASRFPTLDALLGTQ